jgi:hypothetical protein
MKTNITHNESIISYVKVTCQSSCSLELVLPASLISSSDKTVKHTVSRAVTWSALETAPHILPPSSGYKEEVKEETSRSWWQAEPHSVRTLPWEHLRSILVEITSCSWHTLSSDWLNRLHTWYLRQEQIQYWYILHNVISTNSCFPCHLCTIVISYEQTESVAWNSDSHGIAYCVASLQSLKWKTQNRLWPLLTHEILSF